MKRFHLNGCFAGSRIGLASGTWRGFPCGLGIAALPLEASVVQTRPRLSAFLDAKYYAIRMHIFMTMAFHAS